jgi:pyridoxal phosphate enzyme (YggS family)
VIGVTENLALINDLLANSARDAKRLPDAVKLLAVSKKQPVEMILAAAATGQRDFGENFVQEGLAKIQQTSHARLVWHFIGHLQANKTRGVAENFDWVHTVDKIKTARRLSQQRPAALPALNICLQVNIDSESGKSGVAVADLPELAIACARLPNLRLRGLMCLPMKRDGFAAQRAPFAALRELAETLARAGVQTDTLSMGMSNDYAAAIHEGATIVRIGTAIFGKRN